MAYKFPLNTTLGSIEGKNISTILHQKENYELQETYFRFYCNKISELLHTHEFIKKEQNTWEILGIPEPNDAIRYVINILVCRFDLYRYIEFSIFILGYLIIQSYITADTKKYGNVIYYPEKYLESIKQVFLNKEIFVEKAYTLYSNLAPFFGKRCAFGYKTFLDLYLNDKIFLIGMGTNCVNVHCVIFRSNFSVTMHDIDHYNRIKQSPLYSINDILPVYNKILSSEKHLQPGLIYLLFMLIHENSAYNSLRSHINNNICSSDKLDFIQKNFGITEPPNVIITDKEKRFFDGNPDDIVFQTFVYFWRILQPYLFDPLLSTNDDAV